MRKNDSKTNEFSFKAETVKELLDSVMGKADVIMETVKEEKPNLSNDMYDALFAKFAMPANEVMDYDEDALLLKQLEG
jgi:hypothetical protein